MLENLMRIQTMMMNIMKMLRKKVVMKKNRVQVIKSSQVGLLKVRLDLTRLKPVMILVAEIHCIVELKKVFYGSWSVLRNIFTHLQRYSPRTCWTMNQSSILGILLVTSLSPGFLTGSCSGIQRRILRKINQPRSLERETSTSQQGSKLWHQTARTSSTDLLRMFQLTSCSCTNTFTRSLRGKVVRLMTMLAVSQAKSSIISLIKWEAGLMISMMRIWTLLGVLEMKRVKIKKKVMMRMIVT